MPKRAIVIDAWKLPAFEAVLGEEGYSFGIARGIASVTLTLWGEPEKLKPIIAKAQLRAVMSKLH